MAPGGNLEREIGELNGQLAILNPLLRTVGDKVDKVQQDYAAMQRDMKDAFRRIGDLEDSNRAEDGDERGRRRELLNMVLTPLISSVVTGLLIAAFWYVTRGPK